MVVVKPKLAACGGVTLERRRELVERLERRILREIRKRQPDVVGVVKGILWQCICFETADEFVMVHLRHRPTSLPNCNSKSRGRVDH